MDNYERLNQKMNSYVPTNFVKTTLKKLANDSSRLLGSLHANSFELGSIVSYGYSRNNSYGNAIESVFSTILEDNGWKIEPTKYYLDNVDKNKLKVHVPSNKKSIAVDQVFSNDNYFVFIEQKIRDDHDTSKAPGQFENYELKFRILNEIVSDKTVIGIMWMIDSDFSRNKKFYENDEHMGKMKKEFDGRNYLVYGKEIDDILNKYASSDKEYFDTFNSFLKLWHSKTSAVPELNFDRFAHSVSNALDSLNEKELVELFTNNRIIQEAFPIIFPNRESLKTYREKLVLKHDTNIITKKDKKALELLNDFLD